MGKFTLLFFYIILFNSVLQAQSVGVNISTPSENLHVDSTIKVGKNTTLSSPGRKNLIKFGDASYVTIGEEVTDDKMYIRYGDLIFLRSAGSAGSGYIGVGTEIPTANLDVNGTLRIRNNAGAGKLLTSDASGNAAWQTPVSSTGIGFSARLTTDLFLPNGATTNITGFTEDFDDGNTFDPATGQFTAPATGVYQISYNLYFVESGAETKNQTVELKKNGIFFKYYSYIIQAFGSGVSAAATYTNSFIVKLAQGDSISLTVTRQQTGGNTLLGGTSNAATYFSAYKVY